MQEINGLKEIVSSWEKPQGKIGDLKAHAELAEETPDEKEREKEMAEVGRNLAALELEIRALDFQTKLSGPHDKSNAILSLHAGAGGTEACDWAEMLLRMYRRWCERRGFSAEILDILPGEEAGIKSCTSLIKGAHAYGYLKSEVGVHRLVRISPFDANKRRHTSFASCDVIPEIEEEAEIKIEEKDLRIDTYRAGGHGGQNVNKTDSAVRITHIPSGLMVACQVERSQHKNRTLAMKILKARLFEREMEKKRAALEKHYDDKGDIAWGNQIRSYVFMPYQMVKDLRSGYETGNVQAVMDGELDSLIQSYLDTRAGKIDKS